MTTITLTRPLQARKTVQRLYNKNNTKSTERDVTICPGKELVTEIDKESGRKIFHCQSWLITTYCPGLIDRLEKQQMHREKLSKLLHLENSKIQIIIKDDHLHQNMVLAILNYITYGSCTFLRSDASEMLQTAAYLQIQDLQTQCINAFCGDISPNTILDYYKIERDEVNGLCQNLIKNHYKDIIKTTEFGNLKLEDLLAFLNFAANAGATLHELQEGMEESGWIFNASRRYVIEEFNLPKNYNVECTLDDVVKNMFKEVIASNKEMIRKSLLDLFFEGTGESEAVQDNGISQTLSKDGVVLSKM